MFLRSPEGHHTILGFVGAVLIMFGGFGAGAVRRRDPLLEDAHLSWLRFGHGFWLSSILVWVGVLLMITAWVRLGRTTIAGGVSTGELRAIVGIWIFPLLFSVPMFSRDAYSYLAQGALLRDGFDPYAVGPVANPGHPARQRQQRLDHHDRAVRSDLPAARAGDHRRSPATTSLRARSCCGSRCCRAWP